MPRIIDVLGHDVTLATRHGATQTATTQVRSMRANADRGYLRGTRQVIRRCRRSVAAVATGTRETQYVDHAIDVTLRHREHPTGPDHATMALFATIRLRVVAITDR
jgi:hypothetical protein